MQMEAISFLSDWITWLGVLIPVGAGAMVTYQATRKALSDDEGVISDCNTKIKNTIKGAIIGISVAGLITLLKSFYT